VTTAVILSRPLPSIDPREDLSLDFEITRLDHVQLAMPPGSETEAERFYCRVLGFERVPKPPPLAKRGGCWFVKGLVKLHMGIDGDFRPVRRAHPALVVNGFDALCKRLEASGVTVRPDTDLPGTRRCYVEDPFGNSIELIEA
jgi:catechol 2,3-dioxygenase-like lactoylglutathione lyase family enzyme